jgi:ribosomal protein L19
VVALESCVAVVTTFRQLSRVGEGCCSQKDPHMTENKKVAEEPSRESVERMLAFAGLLAAIERKDAKEEIAARRRLRALGVQVQFTGVSR